MNQLRITLTCLLASLSSIPATSAQEAHEGMTADEVAKELANPNNSLASLTFKNQYRWYDGDLPGASDQNNFTILFQPIFPFKLEDSPSGAKRNVFVRPAFPMVFDQPVPSVGSGGFEFDDETALGDIGFDLAYGVTEPNGFIWAFGMVGTLPSATSSAVAGKQLRLGPECLFAYAWDTGLVGIFPSHQWDVTGWGGSAFSTTQIQPVVRFLPGGGWSIGTSPIMNYNWESEEWTVPINLTIGKTIQIGKLPVKLELEANYYVEHPDAFGPEWMIGLNITPVVSNFVEKWLRGLGGN